MNYSNQLSVITDEISQDFEHALDVASEFEIKTVDVRNVWNKNIALLSDDELYKMKEALERRNMRVNVITSPFGKCVLPSSKYSTTKKKSLLRNPEFNLGLFQRIIEISDLFNTANIRIFSFIQKRKSRVENNWEEMINIIKPYVKEAETLGKNLLLENDYLQMVASIKNTKLFFEELNSEAIKLILDPGNYYMEGEPTTTEAYNYFYEKNLVKHIHIKDPKFMISGIDAIFTVVGEGKIDYSSLLKQAIDFNYNGYFCLETHAIRNKEDISRRSLHNIRKILTNL